MSVSSANDPMTPRIARSRRFKMIRGRDVVWVKINDLDPQAEQQTEAMLVDEILPFLPMHIVVEARVAGLDWWIMGCSPEEEEEVAERALEWVWRTGLGLFRRRWLRKHGKSLDWRPHGFRKTSMGTSAVPTSQWPTGAPPEAPPTTSCKGGPANVPGRTP